MNAIYTNFKNRLAKRNRQSVSKNHRQQSTPDTVENAVTTDINRNMSLKPVPELPSTNQKSNDPLFDWFLRAREYQQGCYNSLGDRVWDIISNDKLDKMLEMKIGFALFGILEENGNTDGILGYNDEQKECIRAVRDNIMKVWNSVVAHSKVEPKGLYFSCVFVYLYLKKEKADSVEVLFKLPKSLENLHDCYFIDSNRRVYDNWKKFLNDNKLPKCYMYYPTNGVYTASDDVVDIDCKESPSCKLIKTVLTGLDVGTTILSVGAIGVDVAACFVPVAAPFVWGATATLVASSTYEASRNVSKLVDKQSHKESIGLQDPESRSAWLGIAASATSVVAAGGTAITRGLARSRGVLAGEEVVRISRRGIITLRIINLSSAAVSGINIINSIFTIVDKVKNGTLNKRDIQQFAVACYFFLNAIVSFNNANRLIQEIATTDKANLFHSTKNCDFQFTKSAMDFQNSATYCLLRSFVLNQSSRSIPNININKVERNLMRLTRLVDKFSTGSPGYRVKLIPEVVDVFGDIWVELKDVIIKAKDGMCGLFSIKNADEKRDCKPLLHISPDFARQFCLVIQETIGHCNLDDNDQEFKENILALINDLPECSIMHLAEFLNRTKYVCECVMKEFDVIKEEYSLSNDLPKFNLGDSSKNTEEPQHIEGNKYVHFFKATISKLRTENSLKEIASAYSATTSNNEQHENIIPFMETSVSRHYAFSGRSGIKVLIRQQYWQKANDVTNANLNDDNSIILIKNEFALIIPNDSCNIKAVLFYSSYERNRVLGIMTVIKNINMLQE